MPAEDDQHQGRRGTRYLACVEFTTIDRSSSLKLDISDWVQGLPGVLAGPGNTANALAAAGEVERRTEIQAVLRGRA